MDLIRRPLKVVSVVLVVSMLGGLILTACANQADNNTVAKYVPANAQAFVTVALSPSVKQKASLLVMSQHLPADVHADEASKVRDNLLSELFKSGNISYENEIKPWLGTEAAFAVVPPVDGSNAPIVIGAVQAKNKAQAKKTLDSHHVDASSYRFIKGYVFFVDGDQFKAHQAGKALDQVQQVANGKAASLQSSSRYKTNIATLHGEHIVLGWIDIPALMKEGVATEKAVRQNETTKQALDDSTQDVTPDAELFGNSEDGFDAKGTATAFTQTVSSTGDTDNSAVNDLSADLPGDSSADDSTTDDSADNGITDDPSSLFGGDSGGGLAGLGAVSNDSLVNDGLDKAQAAADAIGSYSFEVYAATNGVIFEGVSEHASKGNGAPTNRALVNGLPADIVGAVDVADFGTGVRKLLSNLTTGKDAPEPNLEKTNPQIFELANTLKGEAVMAVGSAPKGSAVPVGMVATVADNTTASKAVSDLVSSLKQQGAVVSSPFVVLGGTGWKLQQAPDPLDQEFFHLSATDEAPSSALYVAVANNRLAISTTSVQAKSFLNDGGGFGGSGAATQAFGTTPHLTFGSFYINLQSAIKMAQADQTSTSPTAQSWFNSLNVVGAQTWSDGGHDFTEVRLALK